MSTGTITQLKESEQGTDVAPHLGMAAANSLHTLQGAAAALSELGL